MLKAHCIVFCLTADSFLSDQIETAISPIELVSTDSFEVLSRCLANLPDQIGPIIIDFRTFSPLHDSVKAFVAQVKKYSDDIYGVVKMAHRMQDHALIAKIFELGVVNYFTPNRIDDLINALLTSQTLQSRYVQQWPLLKVAIVEDCTVFRDSLRMSLGLLKLGEVRSFRSAQSLIDFGFKFDFYLIDIVLPDISGLTLIQSIRKSEKGTPCTIVAMSSVEGEGIKNQAIRAGANHFLKKPITVQSVLENIATMVAQRNNLTTEQGVYNHD